MSFLESSRPCLGRNTVAKDVFKSFAQHLKRHGLRLTEERKGILNLILSMKGHFSAEQILNKIKKDELAASRATLYRLLPVLVEAEVIQQSLLSEGQTRYEVTWDKDHHDHLICKNCNRVIEFQDNTIEILQREIASKYGFKLEHHVMELVGLCSRCQKSGSSGR